MLLSTSILSMTWLSGCATTTLDPALYGLHSMAVASIHAKRNISLTDANASPFILQNDWATETLEMDLGEYEGRLSEIFGVEVVPPGKTMMAKAYNRVPEEPYPEDWTRLNDMTAVDMSSPATPPALGALAKELSVDAIVVLRHEWSFSRDPFNALAGLTFQDVASILVVDARGVVVWSDAASARQPMLQTLLPGTRIGLANGPWAEDARRLARLTGRAAMDGLARRYQQGRDRPER